MKDTIGICGLLATVIVLSSFLQDVASFPMQESNEQALLQSNNENSLKEAYTPNVNYDARMKLYMYLMSILQNSGPGPNNRKKEKRTCRLNAGLSHACDYKDTLDAIHEGMYLGSDMTPGRK